MDWGQILNNTAYWVFSPETIAYALAATGLAVQFGYGGLLNFGMAGFMALGAYGYAISILSFGWPWWVGIIVGCLAATVFAIILGIPTLRLRADYLAIVTIAAAEIVRLLLTTQLFDEFTNSADGLGGYHAGFRGGQSVPRGDRGRHEDDLRLRSMAVDRRPAVGARLRHHPARHRGLPGVGAHAQPVGPRAQGHPRGRGRRALARQERLLVQDAGAHHRWCLRRARRGRVRASLGRRPGDLHDVADVLHLDDPAAGRRGDGLRPGRRVGHLLGHHGVPRQRAAGARPVRRAERSPASRPERSGSSWWASRSCSS